MNIKRILLITSATLVVAGVISLSEWTRLRAQSPGVNSPWGITWGIPLDSIKRTYALQATNLSPPGVPQDLLQICGAAGVTTKVQRFVVSGRATAVAGLDLIVQKRSSLDTGGVFASNTPWAGTPIAAVSIVGQSYDSTDGASVATVTAYTSAPIAITASVNAANNFTFGTVVANIAAAQLFLGNLTTGTPSQNPAVIDWGNRPSKAPTLRSATQCLGVATSPTGLAANVIDAYVEWTEE